MGARKAQPRARTAEGSAAAEHPYTNLWCRLCEGGAISRLMLQLLSFMRLEDGEVSSSFKM